MEELILNVSLFYFTELIFNPSAHLSHFGILNIVITKGDLALWYIKMKQKFFFLESQKFLMP